MGYGCTFDVQKKKPKTNTPMSLCKGLVLSVKPEEILLEGCQPHWPQKSQEILPNPHHDTLTSFIDFTLGYLINTSSQNEMCRLQDGIGVL